MILWFEWNKVSCKKSKWWDTRGLLLCIRSLASSSSWIKIEVKGNCVWLGCFWVLFSCVTCFWVSECWLSTLLTVKRSKQTEHQEHSICFSLLATLPLLHVQHCQRGAAWERVLSESAFHGTSRDVNPSATLVLKDFFQIPCFYDCEEMFVLQDWQYALAYVQGDWMCTTKRGFLSPKYTGIN